ncbi:hypothetical protein [Oceanospirillum beijerinckii]|uniref:hypothetical protein n=1 Tax=Oceanospirillum beijerinckii TaxID=64976 RepID=UPI000413E3EE|nr:hypothetical protein [Oceanospirillum beijerinckii]
MSEVTITPAQALASLQTAVGALVGQVQTKFGQIDGSITAQLNAAISDLRTQLTGTADVDNDTLGKVAGRIDQLDAAIQALDDTYATDADLAQKISDINTAWAAADGDVQALLANKIDATAAQVLADDSVAAAKTYTDQQLVIALQGLTTAFNNGTATLTAQ